MSALPEFKPFASIPRLKHPGRRRPQKHEGTAITRAEKNALSAAVIEAAMACHLTQHGGHILLSMLETQEQAAKLLAALAEMRRMRNV